MKPKRILIYSGTTEGRQLARVLEEAKLPSLVCVATAYGEWMMESSEHIEVRVGRQSAEEMQQLLDREEFAAVVDATHPYATAVTKQIRDCMKGRKIPLLRLLRSTAATQTYPHIRYFQDSGECAAALEKTEGNILLTTGSKELKCFTENTGLKERLYVRVLPSGESLAQCEDAGICAKQIIAMQGPFSKAMNLAMLGQFGIRHLVTKESGRNGGFEEKLQAAEEAGILCYVIKSPGEEEGYTLREVIERLGSLLESVIPLPPREITLVGMGMGNPDMLTKEAERAVYEARYVFGAGRLLEQLPYHKECVPLYRPEDVLPRLEKLDEEDGGEGKAVILFSGDTGFYSGAGKLYEALCKQKRWKVVILPGISTISAFSARCGVTWQDAKLLSLHGRREGEWESILLDAVRHEKKTFCLLSGSVQLDAVCALLCEHGLENIPMHVGYQLSYPEETLSLTTPGEWSGDWGEGLYVTLLENCKAYGRQVSCGHRDEEFVRGPLPMTKEEVRSIVIAKLRLTGEAVLYDIGSGTGSVAVEAALLSPAIQVFAFECKEEGCELIRENARRFHCGNVTVIPGMAPQSMEPACEEELPMPTHAFIGGSRGGLLEILDRLYRKNPLMRVVITAISLETISILTGIADRYPMKDWEWTQVQVSRSTAMGEHRLLKGENPVVICSFRFQPSADI